MPTIHDMMKHVANTPKPALSSSDLLAAELGIAEQKAWDSLSRYKFQMFGYWAAIWVHLNRIGKFGRPNPWRDLVRDARIITRPTHRTLSGIGSEITALQGKAQSVSEYRAQADSQLAGDQAERSSEAANNVLGDSSAKTK